MMVVEMVLGDKLLVAVSRDPFSPAAIVERGALVSDVRPLGVWQKFLYFWQPGNGRTFEDSELAERILAGSRTDEYRKMWFDGKDVEVSH
ncbi:MAG: hypothetical protein ROW52_03230 [Anaerolineaceae bacterium]|jgi:hypothetical protein